MNRFTFSRMHSHPTRRIRHAIRPARVIVLAAFLSLGACVVPQPIYTGSGPQNDPAAPQSGSPDRGASPATGPMVEMVEAHNIWRRNVSVPPLQWSAQLADTAQRWANTLQAEGCSMRHSSGGAFGENLSWSQGRRMTPSQVVDLWAEERFDYSYENNQCAQGKVCGHYTQVVWADTSTLGCGVARCGDAEVWVCNYQPPGNYLGQRPY